MAVWTISANYDFESNVWYSNEGDVPGLAVDASTLEELQLKAARLVPDLLAIHSDRFDAADLAGPHTLRVVAFVDHMMAVAS